MCSADTDTGPPLPVADPGGPIDYRFSLANERTFLAWIRTALGLLAGGVAVQTLTQQLPNVGLRRAITATCAAQAVLIAAAAHRHWRQAETAMRRGEELPPPALMPFLAATVAVVAILTTTSVLVS
ncbi:YidH family protein [Nocardia sp. NPDC059239]|uniref:YidH family protein n=1 Tax=unclassified Nocardia TaxID=2637762 RepID=UPI0036B0005C